MEESNVNWSISYNKEFRKLINGRKSRLQLSYSSMIEKVKEILECLKYAVGELTMEEKQNIEKLFGSIEYRVALGLIKNEKVNEPEPDVKNIGNYIGTTKKSTERPHAHTLDFFGIFLGYAGANGYVRGVSLDEYFKIFKIEDTTRVKKIKELNDFWIPEPREQTFEMITLKKLDSISEKIEGGLGKVDNRLEKVISERLLHEKRYEEEIVEFSKDNTEEKEFDQKKISILDFKKKLKKLRVDVIDNVFIEKQKKLTSNPKYFYEFAVPEWGDIIFNYDIKRDQQDGFLELIQNMEHQFLTLVASSGSGKSTFLKRIAIELYKEEYLILFWKDDFEIFNHDIIGFIEVIEDFISDIESPVYMFIDNCFRIDIFQLIIHLRELPNLKIIGASQGSEYDEKIEKDRRVKTRFLLNNLTPLEIEICQDKLLSLGLISNKNNNIRVEENVHFEELIATLIPENRIDARITSFLDKLKGESILLEIFELTCLSYRLGVKLPFQILKNYIDEKEDKDHFKANILTLLNSRTDEEIIFLEGKESFRLRHEIWAAKGLSCLSIKEEYIHSYYCKLFYYADFSKDENRAFFFKVFKSLEVNLSQKIYSEKRFGDIKQCLEEYISGSQY